MVIVVVTAAASVVFVVIFVQRVFSFFHAAATCFLLVKLKAICSWL